LPAVEQQNVTEVLAANIRAFRQLRGLDQRQLGVRMQSLGPKWWQVTVSEVERGQRNVTVPELVTLTVALDTTVERLLDPRGPERRRGPGLALGEHTVKPGDGPDRVEYVDEPTVIEAHHVAALVCSCAGHMDVEWDKASNVLRRLDFDLEQTS
jgi:transcriptional regulator with XRE-family HTH domain